MTEISNLHQQTIAVLEERVAELEKDAQEKTEWALRVCDERDNFKEIARKLLATIEVNEQREKIKEELR